MERESPMLEKATEFVYEARLKQIQEEKDWLEKECEKLRTRVEEGDDELEEELHKKGDAYRALIKEEEELKANLAEITKKKEN